MKKTQNPLMSRLLKVSKIPNVSVLDDSVFFKEKDIIPTGIPIIDVAFSGELDGGMVSGLTLFAGPSKSFKSLLSLLCVKAYFDKYPDSICIFYDSEGGMTPEYLGSMGIDPSRVIHVPIEHIEMLKFDIVKQLAELDRKDKVIVVIDSIGNLASVKELQDALDERSVVDMTRAKAIKGLFRMVTPSLISKDVPCICICHTYQEMGLYPKSIISGGTGLMYSSNQAFIIGKSQEKDSEGLSCYKFTINIEKSRTVKEKSKLPFVVSFDKGIQKYSGLMELALISGHVIKPNNGWYSKVDMETGEIEDKKHRLDATNCAEFWNPVLESATFKKFVKDKYKLGAAYISSEEDKDVDDSEEMNEYANSTDDDEDVSMGSIINH